MKVSTGWMLVGTAALALIIAGCSTASKNVAPEPEPAPIAEPAPAPKPVVVPAPAPEPAPAPVYVIKSVNFDFDKSTLKPSAEEILDKAAAALSQQPEVNYEVAGFTDTTGPEGYNQGLSERRAGAVQGYLVEHGVAAEQLTARGYGESNPVADNGTRAGRAENRRVEIRPLK